MLVIPKRLRSETLHRYRYFEVKRHRMRAVRPDGSSDYDVYCLAMPDWATVVAWTVEGSVVLIRQLRYGVDAVMLETPGGIIDDGESAEQAAARELREETGYVAGAVRSMGWVYPNPAFQDNRLHLMVATDCRLTAEPEHDEHESTEAVVLSRRQVIDKLQGGEIRHALSALALERALGRLWTRPG